MATLAKTSTKTDDAAEHNLSPIDAVQDEATLSVGSAVGDFVVERVLGRGSFGTVYQGVHAIIGRRVAIKVLAHRHSADARAVERFVSEAKIVASLRHPHVVEVMHFGRLDDGRSYQVMELVEGPTLGELLCAQGALALDQAMPMLRAIASALDAVHDAGIAHRDLKPANVVLERREGELVPKLIDFGIAKLLEPDRAATATASGVMLGTPQYMAPEQCRGRVVDARADVYAFGVLAYEVLTGEPPFSGEDALELMLKHTTETPLPPSRRASLPRAVDAVLLALLQKNPDDRPSELGAVVDALARAQREPGAPRWNVWVAGAIVAAALAAALAMAGTGRSARPAEKRLPIVEPGEISAASSASATTPPASSARENEVRSRPVTRSGAPPGLDDPEPLEGE